MALLFVACSAIMDCVGCEKCRLWGKLQVLGLGTALKILFTVDGQENGVQTVSTFSRSTIFFLVLCYYSLNIDTLKSKHLHSRFFLSSTCLHWNLSNLGI